MATPIEQALQDGASNLFASEEDKATFRRRLLRSMKRQVRQNSVEEFLDNALKIDIGHEMDFRFSVRKLERVVKDHPGSATAMSLLQSAVCCVLGHDALEQGNIKMATAAFSEAYRKNSMVVQWDFAIVPIAMEAFQDLYSDMSIPSRIRAEALFVHANLLFLQQEVAKGLQKLQLAQALLPVDAYFPAVEGCVWAMLMDKRKARGALGKAASLGCDDPEHTLFHRAILLDSTCDETTYIELLERYVEVAPPDARKLPEACYRLALVHGYKGPLRMGAAKRFFLRGEEASKHRLKDLFPDEAAMWRKQARSLVKSYTACGYEKCNSAAASPCSACGKAFYCSQDCLNADWPSHKSFCKKERKRQKK